MPTAKEILIPSKTTPTQLGYRMPAEWEKHEGTWLAWPHNTDTWPTELAAVQKTWIQMIKVLHEHEKVHLLVDDAEEETVVKKKLEQASIIKNVLFYKIPTIDVWLRDSGPIFIVKERGGRKKKKQLAMASWTFNAWGMKYTDLAHDTTIPDNINEVLKILMFKPNIVLEGGSIDANGKGMLLTTEQCLLNKNRNPQLSRGEIEKYLKEYLGVTKIIWLKEGIAGDDTDGHVDDLARFVNPTTVVCALEEDPTDENYVVLKKNHDILKQTTDQDGNPLMVIPLPMPGNVEVNGQRLPASYTNFLIANEVVLVPIFNHSNDKKAGEILQQCFPDRKIIGIDCTQVVYGLGAIHCVSQQQPAV